jgi:hypothetical protein
MRSPDLIWTFCERGVNGGNDDHFSELGVQKYQKGSDMEKKLALRINASKHLRRFDSRTFWYISLAFTSKIGR